jgi:prepilin-type N-terminal cleavage/methylation domain-containing protein
VSRRNLDTQGGFSLTEVLTTIAILAIGLVATAVAFQHAISGIEVGRGETTATFLAEHKLEELKGLAVVDWAHVALKAGTATEYCPPADAACGPAPTPGTHRRVTTVTDNPGAPCTVSCKVVRVTVSYRPISGTGSLDQDRTVELSTMFVARP